MPINGREAAMNSGSNYGVIANDIHGEVKVILPKEDNRLFSHIGNLVKGLSCLSSEIDEDILQEKLDKKWELKDYTFDGKMQFNSIKKYRMVIEEFSKYSVRCDEIFNRMDDHDIGSKSKILKNIRRVYLHTIGEIIGDEIEKKIIIEKIRQNADNIIDSVKDTLREELINEFNGSSLYREDMEDALETIICYAFMECKILEKPGGKYDIESE